MHVLPFAAREREPEDGQLAQGKTVWETKCVWLSMAYNPRTTRLEAERHNDD